MPKDIKRAAIALIISCLSTLMAAYFEGLEFEEISLSDPTILGMNIVWALVVAWIVWDLCKGKDIKLTIVLVGLIMFSSTVWDISEYGFGISHVFYMLELVMFSAAYFFVSTKESKLWYANKSL